MNCKDFNNLSVLSLYEGELLGTVDKLYFDKKIKKLCLIELVGEDGVKLMLPTKNIYHVGKNAITVKNNQAVSLKENFTDLCVAPISSKAYSINGEFLGVVEEIGFNNKFQTDEISLDNGEKANVKDIASCGKNTVVFFSQGQKLNLKNFTPTETPNQFKGEEVQTQILPVQENDDVKKTKATLNESFLLGRVCTKDIYNFNNELLIKAHGVVSKKNLKEITKFGKLRELMLFIK